MAKKVDAFPQEPELRKPAQNTRTFTATGSTLLPVAGLMALQRVWIGDVEIPLTVAEMVPINSDATAHEQVEVELVRLETGASGPVLRRSVKSNDGFWQQGAQITVQGSWEPDKK